MLKQKNLEKEVFKQIFYIDIKFKELKDVLRIALQNVYKLSLKKNKIIV